MSNDGRAKNPEAYVQEVTQATLSHLEDLLEEVGTLRALVSALERDRDRLEVETTKLRRELGERQSGGRTTLRLSEDPPGKRNKLADEYRYIAQEHADLANLYVASYRLHESLDRAQVLEVIQEIVINLVGSEDFAIYERAPDGESLVHVGSFGREPGACGVIPTRGTGPIARTLERGEVTIIDAPDRARVDGHEAGLSACVPLRLGGEVLGVILVFSLLAHKAGLTRGDRQMLELLATQAGMALHSSNLHAAHRSKVSSAA